MAVIVHCLFLRVLRVLWVGMQCTIRAIPGHTYLLFGIDLAKEEREKDFLMY